MLEFNGFGSAVHSAELHAGSRHDLQVLHTRFVHGGCSQSLQRLRRLSDGNPRRHTCFLHVGQKRNSHPGQRKASVSHAAPLHALKLPCFFWFGFFVHFPLNPLASSRHDGHLGQSVFVHCGYRHCRQTSLSLFLLACATPALSGAQPKLSAVFQAVHFAHSIRLASVFFFLHPRHIAQTPCKNTSCSTA